MRRLSQAFGGLSCLAMAGCFPTFQTARIDPGFRLEASAILLNDQARNGTPQGNDFLAFVTPAYGFGRRVELGLPIGLYAEEGLNSRGRSATNALLVMPYVKFGLLDEASQHHLALIGQAVYILPANVGLRYGIDLGAWEPHVGFNWIMSGGEAGDDPAVTRYQKSGQTLFSVSAGATLNRPATLAFEIGVLRNRYEEFAPRGPTEFRTVMATYYDLFAGIRVSRR